MTGRDLDNNTLPIPFKGYTDLIIMDGENLDIVDHKLVTSFTTEVSPHYLIQACAYFFTFREKYGIDPRRAIFDEVKKSKNRDGSPQINRCVIEFKKINLYIFLEIYARALRMLS
jgi:RecB family exonuclease